MSCVISRLQFSRFSFTCSDVLFFSPSFFLFVCFYLGVVVMDMIVRKFKYFFSDHSSQSNVNLCFSKILSIALAILTFFKEFCTYLCKLKLGTVLMSFSDTSMLLLACVPSCYSCTRTTVFWEKQLSILGLSTTLFCPPQPGALTFESSVLRSKSLSCLSFSEAANENVRITEAFGLEKTSRQLVSHLPFCAREQVTPEWSWARSGGAADPHGHHTAVYMCIMP